jgi:MFS family permease
MNRYIQLLRNNPDFARLWVAQAISQLGDWFNTIVLSALIAKYTDGSGLAIGGLLLARFLPPLIVSPIAGVLLDRFDRRRMLIFSDIARVFIVLGFLFADSPDMIWLIYLLTILQFAVSAIFEPGRSAIIPSVCRPEDLIHANLLGSITWSIMLAAGGTLGGLVAGLFGTSTALFIDAATFAISAVLIMQIPPQRVERNPTDIERPMSSLGDFVEGLRYAAKNPSISLTLLVKFGGNFGSNDTLIIVYATSLFVLGEDGALSLGIFWAAFGIGAVIGPLLLNRFNDGSVKIMRRLIIAGYGVMTLGWLLLGSAPTIAVVAFAMIIRACGSSTYWTYSSVIIQKTVDNAYAGRMFSLDWMGFQLATVISVIVTSAALETLGNQAARTITFATAFISLIPLVGWTIAVLLIEKYERVRHPQTEPAIGSSIGT